MGLPSIVQWWDEWQLRILVLGSLGMQWILLVTADMRKYTIGSCFRTFIWLAYISSDALAIYALATLFNRHARASSAAAADVPGNNILEVLWAPVLLIHLGGQEHMTAYAIEDNELWTRQAVTLVSQVTVAVYAFYKSWPSSSDTRLLSSAIVLFVTGILSFSEKPWALKRATINRLAVVSSSLASRRNKKSECLDDCFSEVYMEEWIRELRMDKQQKKLYESKKGRVLSDRDKVHMILSDMSLRAANSDLKKWQQEAEDEVLDNLGPSAEMATNLWLERAFALIYTRVNLTSTPVSLAYHVLVLPSLHATAIALFTMSRKHGYSAVDVRTTYVLLYSTAALHVFAGAIRFLLGVAMTWWKVPALCETVPQYSNIIRSARRRLHPVYGPLLRCTVCVGLPEGYFNSYWSACGDQKLYRQIVGYIFNDIVQLPDVDLAGYRSFTERNWALRKALRDACSQSPAIRDSLRDSFDRSVVVWHLATDLCFCTMFPAGRRMKRQEVCTQAISNYMVHLLNFRPDMLLTGSRKHLFTQVVDEVEAILKLHNDKKIHLFTQDELARIIMDHQECTSSPSKSKEPLVHEARDLAKELMSRDFPGGDEDRLELMNRVWLGMLCYSASMCRGYLHAKSLGEGGEFLSFVWLVLSLRGAMTLADKLQMPELETVTGDPHLRDQKQEEQEEEEDISSLFS